MNICGNLGKGSKAKLDYHAWRLGENIGIVGCIFSVLLIPSFWSLLLTFGGSWMLGYFVYERALNYVVRGELFKQDKTEYHIMGFVLPRRQWQDYIVVGVGVILLILGVVL